MSKAKPFLKWAGGKHSLLPELVKRLPRSYTTYNELFLGGGALFFEVSPISANLSDINSELINTYTQVRDNVMYLMQDLADLWDGHDEEFYYKIRKNFKNAPYLTRAAQFIYLNKTCFNGLYRENKSGEFNVPVGSYKNPKILDEDCLLEANKALQGTTLLSQ